MLKSHLKSQLKSQLNSIIDDSSLAARGEERMEWFRAKMPIIESLNQKFAKEKPFAGRVIAVCMHIEPKTAYWIEGLLQGGASHIYLVGCLGTTKADTAAYLASLDRMTVLGKAADTYEDHRAYLSAVMEAGPVDLFLDNGGSLNLAYHEKPRSWRPTGANEETRSGRLLLEREGVRPEYPILVIDDSPVKRLLENAVGVGQSVVDGFMRATSLLVGGKQVLVIGYGYCGSGVAAKFKGLGAITMVCDANPIYQLKAKVDGHLVGELEELILRADVIITVTGRFNIITASHISLLKNGVILANSGHYGFEIDAAGLREAASQVKTVRPGIEELWFHEKRAFLLENASPLNLSAGDGNPIEIMDLGLGLQAACAYRLTTSPAGLENGMQTVPEDINEMISRLSLKVLE